jgi:cell division septation protein DedD
MNKVACASCRHEIDATAKICPYCGSDPATGQKIVDTTALLEEMFKPRHLSASENILEYARHRQGVVIAVSAAVLFLVLAALHQFVTMRNDREVSAAPAVPLTEITDVSTQADETKALPMPELQFQYEGRPQAMRSFVMESGAVTPPEVVAQQQQAQQQAALQQQAKQQAAAQQTAKQPAGQQPATQQAGQQPATAPKPVAPASVAPPKPQ